MLIKQHLAEVHRYVCAVQDGCSNHNLSYLPVAVRFFVAHLKCAIGVKSFLLA